MPSTCARPGATELALEVTARNVLPLPMRSRECKPSSDMGRGGPSGRFRTLGPSRCSRTRRPAMPAQASIRGVPAAVPSYTSCAGPGCRARATPARTDGSDPSRRCRRRARFLRRRVRLANRCDYRREPVSDSSEFATAGSSSARSAELNTFNAAFLCARRNSSTVMSGR